MEAAFCVEALEEALARHGKPEIFNTDQGSQFTSLDFTSVLTTADVAISMDGKGAWRDNVFVERLWRSVKYEEVYLRAYDSVSEARASIGRYLAFYNRGGRIRALTGARPTRLISTASNRRWPHDRRQRFCRSSGRATPSRRRSKIASPAFSVTRQEST